MRTLRLSLAGTVILALLGGLSGVVVAQSEDEATPEAVMVSGTTEAGAGSTGDLRVDGPMIHIRDAFFTSHYETNDPRVTGQWIGTWNLDGLGTLDVGPMWGTARLENEDGAWEGAFSGISYPPDDASISGWSVGEDGYAGLMFYFQAVSSGNTGTVKGMIFEGEMPPFPEPTE